MGNRPTDQGFARRLLSGDLSEPGTGWGDAELAVAWNYLLGLELGSLVAARPPATVTAARTPIADLLHARGPQPVELLRALKDWAQSLMRGIHRSTRTLEPIPPHAASALYHLAIVLALTWHGLRISSMDDEALAEGVQWALDQKWIDPHSHAIFSRWLFSPRK